VRRVVKRRRGEDPFHLCNDLVVEHHRPEHHPFSHVVIQGRHVVTAYQMVSAHAHHTSPLSRRRSGPCTVTCMESADRDTIRSSTKPRSWPAGRFVVTIIGRWFSHLLFTSRYRCISVASYVLPPDSSSNSRRSTCPRLSNIRCASAWWGSYLDTSSRAWKSGWLTAAKVIRSPRFA